MSKETQIEHLIKLIRKEKVSLFIGAGFSLEAQAPSVWDLQQAILNELPSEEMKKEHTEDTLDEISQFFVDEVCEGSKAELMDLLQTQFDFEPVCMDDHHALAQIPHFHNIFTTNYDTLLEDSYPKNEREVIRKDDDIVSVENKQVRIFKIHGDFTNQDFIVITKQDYEDLKKQNSNPLVWNEVKSEFTKKHIVFIGYSLSDENIINMIKYISELVGYKQRQMFLIAPKIPEAKKNQLYKMKVSYIEATASEFLSLLKKGIDDNIGPDYRHHVVSDYTFNKYCEIRGFDPIVKRTEQRKKKNDIVNFEPLPGHKLEHQIQMTIDAKYKDLLENVDFEKNGVIVKNSPFPNVPFYHFSGKGLIKCTHSVNGLVMNDEIASVFVGPAVNDFPMTIKIPSRNFLEKVVAKSYSPRKGKAVIDLDCHIYNLKMIIEVKEKNELGTHLTTTFNFTFKDSYIDNELAIRWINLVCAFYSKEDITIKEISNIPFNAANGTGNNFNNHFNEFKEYYENIKQIEMLSDINFSVYNSCTEDAYKKSCIILSYLKHEPVLISCPNGLDFSTEAKFAEDFMVHVDDEKNMLVVSTEDGQKTFLLNDKSFVIPYTHNIFNSCVIKNVEKQDDGFMKVDFHYGAKYFAKLYSNRTVDEDFPDLKKLEDCKELKKIKHN